MRHMSPQTPLVIKTIKEIPVVNKTFTLTETKWIQIQSVITDCLSPLEQNGLKNLRKINFKEYYTFFICFIERIKETPIKSIEIIKDCVTKDGENYQEIEKIYNNHI